MWVRRPRWSSTSLQQSVVLATRWIPSLLTSGSWVESSLSESILISSLVSLEARRDFFLRKHGRRAESATRAWVSKNSKFDGSFASVTMSSWKAGTNAGRHVCAIKMKPRSSGGKTEDSWSVTTACPEGRWGLAEGESFHELIELESNSSAYKRVPECCHHAIIIVNGSGTCPALLITVSVMTTWISWRINRHTVVYLFNMLCVPGIIIYLAFYVLYLAFSTLCAEGIDYIRKITI